MPRSAARIGTSLAALALAGATLVACDDAERAPPTISAGDAPTFTHEVVGQVWELRYECDLGGDETPRLGTTRIELRPTADPDELAIVDLDGGELDAVGTLVAPDVLAWELAGGGDGSLVLRDDALLYDIIAGGEINPPVKPEDCVGTAGPAL